MKNYYLDRNKKNMEKVSQILANLPSYCFDYFIFMENYSTCLTRLNYANDLMIFYTYLSKYVFSKEIKLISVDDLDILTSQDIERYMNYLNYYEYNGETRTNSQTGKARKLSTLRSFFKYFFNKNLLKSNVTAKVDTPKIRTKEIIRLDVDEVVKIINEAENQTSLSPKQRSLKSSTSIRDTAILTLLLGTGIRVSECVGLNVEDIDFNNNAFKVTRKGGNQVVLYFSDEVSESLRTWLNKRALMLESVERDENALFISLQKKRICVRAVEKLVKKYAQIAAPLKKITPHKLRSTYGTNLYKETQDIYIVAEVLGHKDVNTTKKHYAAIGEDIRRSAANKVKLR